MGKQIPYQFQMINQILRPTVVMLFGIGFNANFCDGHAEFIKNSTLGMWTSRKGD